MRSTSRLHVSIVLTAGTLLLFGQTACSDKGGTTPPTPVPTTVTLSKTSVSLAATNGTAQVTASVESVSGSAAVTVAQVAAQVQKVAGDAQTDTVAQVLPESLKVQVNDSRGNPISGVTVNLSAAAGAGSVAPTSGATGANGQVAASWTLGTSAGNQTVGATPASGTGSATFSATAVADAPDTLLKDSGDNQSGPPAGQLANPVTVKVADQYGNGVSGVTVAFAASGSGSAK